MSRIKQKVKVEIKNKGETRKRIKQSKKFIQFIAYINVPMKRMKIKERFG